MVSQISLSHWMDTFRPEIGGKALERIVVAGSHDAGTGVPHATLVPDRQTNKKIYRVWSYFHQSTYCRWCADVIASTVIRLGRAQSVNVYAQLNNGIRYFDLRLYDTGKGIRLTHGFLGESIESVISGIKTFLLENPNEYIFLQERQREGFTLKSYEAYIDYLDSELGSFLVPNSYDTSTTYNELLDTSHRVMYILPVPGSKDPPVQNLGFKEKPFLWPPSRATSKWPDAQSVRKIQSVFASQFNEWADNRSQLCSAQVVFSPTRFQYFKYALSFKTLQEVNLPLSQAMPNLLEGWNSKGMNIIMTDFTAPGVVQTIINVNE